MLASPSDRLGRVFGRVVDGLCDAAGRRRAALLLAVAYGLAWWVYAIVAKSSQDLNADMAEMVVWAQQPALGYSKHPPLLAWVLAVWFAIFPHADWAFWLLSAITLAAGLYLAFELAGEWLEGEKRAAVPFLLAVIPFYNFLGLKFDQNSGLIPLWALALWAFVRSFDRGHLGWGTLAGLAAAAAMLTKYWSGFLIMALALAALFHPRRREYFRSAAPWVAATVLTLAVLPHVIWLVREDFPPFIWVASRRVSDSWSDCLRTLVEYLLGTVGYGGGAILLVLLLAKPPLRAIRDICLPGDPMRRTAAILFYAPILLPIIPALASRVRLLSLWNTPALNLLPVMLLASPCVVLARNAIVRLAAGVTAFTLGVVLVSPIIAGVILERGVENYAAYGRQLAARAEREWNATTDRPLKIVGGLFKIVNTAAFYMPTRPTTFADFSRYLSPNVDEALIAREGMVIICPAKDAFCMQHLEAIAARGPAGRRTEVTLRRRWLWLEGAAERFVIATVPGARL
jgi:4-amino-4-deoxy-L-arabinose transferase-like glycosyltransferase